MLQLVTKMEVRIGVKSSAHIIHNLPFRSLVCPHCFCSLLLSFCTFYRQFSDTVLCFANFNAIFSSNFYILFFLMNCVKKILRRQ